MSFIKQAVYCFKEERNLANYQSYIGDEEKTKAAFDDEGYFKTGDFAELKDGEYIFSGRANTDCKTFSHKLLLLYSKPLFLWNPSC